MSYGDDGDPSARPRYPAELQVKISKNINSLSKLLTKVPPKKHKILFKNQTRREYIIRCCGRNSCHKINRKKSKNNPRGPSYKPVRIKGKKYTFPPEKETYEEAKKKCEDQGLVISGLESKTEQKSVTDYLNYIGLSSEVVFSALDQLAIPGSIFDGWGTEPPKSIIPGDCSATYKGKFYNTSCDQPANFICEEPPGSTSTLEGLASLLSIDEAPMDYVNGKNYIVPSNIATVDEANSLCSKQGMELMSLESLAETSAVQDFLGDIGLSTSTMLTSLKKLSGGDEFNWLGGVAANLLNWAPEQPNPDGGCASLGKLGLQGISCDTVANFVCEAPNGPSTVATTTENPLSKLLAMADSTPVVLGDSSYIVPSEKANYDNAQEICGTRDMGLMSLETLAETDVVQDFLGSIGLSSTSVLTSLKRSGVDTFDWFGSLTAQTVKVASSPEDVASGKDCAGLSSIGLAPVSCNDLSNFVCESKPTEPPTTAVTFKVGLVNAKINGNSYFFSEEKATYADANAVCSTRGQSLLVIDNLLENMGIKEAIKQSGFQNMYFFTSLKEDVPGTYVWTGGAELVPSNVEINTVPQGSLPCGAYYQLAFTFVDCAVPYNFICESPGAPLTEAPPL